MRSLREALARCQLVLGMAVLCFWPLGKDCGPGFTCEAWDTLLQAEGREIMLGCVLWLHQQL